MVVDGYRRNAHAVLREVWNKRNEGWLAAAVLVILVGAAEMLTLWACTVTMLALILSCPSGATRL